MANLSRKNTAREPIFRPPLSAARKRKRVWTVAGYWTAVVAVLALIGTVAVVATSGPSRPVLCAHLSPPFRVVKDKADGECVGITDGSFTFDANEADSSGIRRAEDDIAAENARLPKGKYVTVALLTPLTWSPDSVVSLNRIRNELEGAYVGQHAANDVQDVNPKIRLVLANEGSLEQDAPQVVSQLKALVAPPDRLVAVVGMGISVSATAKAARALSAAHIPMIGSVDTGDTLDWTHVAGLARVAVSTEDEVATITGYLKAHGGLGTAFLVSDTDTHDLYTSGLRKDFEKAFGTRVSGEEPYGPGPSIGNEFNLIADDVCGLPGTPPSIVYAGRESVLPNLIQQLRSAPACNGKRLTVVTGSDAEGLDPKSLAPKGKPQQPDAAQVSVLYPGLDNPGRITPQFRGLFTASFGTTGIGDPWMIQTNDAMAAAARAIALATGGSSTPPLPLAVQDAIPLLNRQHKVEGATGSVSIGSDGNVMNPDIPIFKIAGGSRTLLSP